MRPIFFLFLALFTLKHTFAQRPTILVFRKKGESFKQVYESMKNELEDRYQFVDIAKKKTNFEEFHKKIKEEKPIFLVLMDNKYINYGIKYNSESNHKINGLALMGLNLKKILKGNKHIFGIAYETPAYTLITQYKNIAAHSVKNVLVVHRGSFFNERIQTASTRLKDERIVLRAIDAEKDGKTKKSVIDFVTKNLPLLAKDSKSYDLVWVLLDSGLLNSSLFNPVWIKTARSSSIPFIVGTEKLVSPKFNFAVFGISPDLVEYGQQAAQMADFHLNDKESPETLGVEDLISVKKVFNQTRAEELKLSYNKEKLSDTKILSKDSSKKK